jgi:hypothetical protein
MWASEVSLYKLESKPENRSVKAVEDGGGQASPSFIVCLTTTGSDSARSLSLTISSMVGSVI